MCEEQQVPGKEQYTREIEKAILKWSMKLSETEKNQLLEGGTVKKKVNISLKGKRGTTLWPVKMAGIAIKAEKSQKYLKISYLQTVDRMVDTRIGRRQRMNVNRLFKCELDGDGALKTLLLYKNGAKQMGEYEYPGISRVLFEFQVTLLQRCRASGDGEAIECNLKVTDGSDLKDWWI